MEKKSLFTHSTYQCSKVITRQYSTSFSWGIRIFDAEFRPPIYSIYALVRYADEIVDTFHEQDKVMLISEFKADTFRAIEKRISLNPVLEAFQYTAHQYGIDEEYIHAFFHSMEMDLSRKTFSESDYKEYIYGSSEVIGLMCLKVFCAGNKAEFEKLKPYAQCLGSAFQKVNFLRDMKADYEERGRTYFPGIDYSCFTKDQKKKIEQDIEADFARALSGIKLLKGSLRKGVYVAYVYYFRLFKKLRKLPVSEIKKQRIRVPNSLKLGLTLLALLKDKAGKH